MKSGPEAGRWARRELVRPTRGTSSEELRLFVEPFTPLANVETRQHFCNTYFRNLCGALALFVLMFSTSLGTQTTHSVEIVQSARIAVELLEKADYEGVVALFSPRLREKLPEKKVRQIWEDAPSAWDLRAQARCGAVPLQSLTPLTAEAQSSNSYGARVPDK